MPIEIMYMAVNNTITKRRIIVTAIENKYVKVFCFTRNQKRTFKRENILAVAKPRERKVVTMLKHSDQNTVPKMTKIFGHKILQMEVEIN